MKKLLKHGIFVLLAALLVTAVMTSCPPPVGEGYKPPPGMGAISLNVSPGKAAKNIVPTTEVGDFASFKLTFTATAGEAQTHLSPNPKVVDVPGDNDLLEATTFYLIPGTYTVSTIAYMDTVAAGQLLPAATAQNIGVIVTEGGHTPITITLSADLGSGNGTFSWNIAGLNTTAIPSLTSASIAITPNPGGVWATGIDFFTTPGNANTLATPYTLASGKYTVVITASTATSSLYFPQELWVYKNMLSSFVPPSAFTIADFEPITTITVTFYSYNGSTNVAYHTANSVPQNSTIGANMPSTPPTRPNHTFLGWYDTDAHASGGANPIPWGTPVNATTPVGTSNKDVYARWLGPGDLDGTTVELTPLGGTKIVVWNSETNAAVSEGSTIPIANGDPLVLIINNATDFDSYAWNRNGVPINATDTLTFDSTGSPDFNTTTAGTYLIVVTAETDTGEIQSSYFRVVVAGP